MAQDTRPFLTVYIAWHPDFTNGEVLANSLFKHYRRDVYENVSGGIGVSVQYRSTPASGSTVPRPIDIDDSQTTAVVILADKHWVNDHDYVSWGESVRAEMETADLHAQVFPVAIHSDALGLGPQQAIRWFEWSDDINRELRLISNLTYQFCRMLRVYLAHVENPDTTRDNLDHYLKPVEVFLSHTKHDTDGERIARHIRDWLHQRQNYASFFDVHDIPTGLNFSDVILHKVPDSAVIAIHTDAYSSREWCRKEVLEAKRHNVPLIVANCLSGIDERGFPYMGNVPVVRMNPNATNRTDRIIGRLLDEILKDFLWRCRTALVTDTTPDDIVFLPRPPELVSLASEAPQKFDPTEPLTIVYPDPPLGSEEERLFKEVAPSIRLRSMTEWNAEAS